MIGTSAGFLVFSLLMFAAVQILFNLYATSMVTSAAHEAAREVAGYAAAADRCAAVADQHLDLHPGLCGDAHLLCSSFEIC